MEADYMKKIALIILCCFVISAIFVGCGNQAAEQEQISQNVAIGNPWSDWASMEEAEAAAGFSFDLPEVIAGSYTAASFRTLNNELIEIIYRDSDYEICVRKQRVKGRTFRETITSMITVPKKLSMEAQSSITIIPATMR
jgi:hypothetical protein